MLTHKVPPVLAEIEYGIARLKDASKKKRLLHQQKEKFTVVIEMLPWTRKSSELFGLIKARLEKSGNLIDDFDIAIAARFFAGKPLKSRNDRSYRLNGKSERT